MLIISNNTHGYHFTAKDDRSHIPPEHRPIHQILVNELQQAKQRSPVSTPVGF